MLSEFDIWVHVELYNNKFLLNFPQPSEVCKTDSKLCQQNLCQQQHPPCDRRHQGLGKQSGPMMVCVG